uniref:Uncharacterized protein n=1 Tax=Panagrolaimus sp. PS1159 TaxID=55785 RepID=A0AC35F6K4_9BILA
MSVISEITAKDLEAIEQLREAVRDH